MKVLKEVIRTGDHTYLDQHGKPQVLRTTHDKIKHYLKSGNEMIAAGLAIPVPLEHQPDAKPMNAMDLAANRLRNNAGEIAEFREDIIKDKDGNDVNRLMSVIDFKDDGIAKKVIDKSIRWVSPWINSFVDGKGKEWNEVISHVALTARPRIHDQMPFENVAMAFSQVMPGSKLKKNGFELPSAGLLKRKDKKLVPEFPVAFSLLTAKFGDDFKNKMEEEDIEDTDDDADDFEEGSAADNDIEAAKEAESGDPMATEMAGDPAMAGNDAGDVSFEELIPHLLEMHGIHVPAGGKGKEFLKALVQGLLTSAKSMAANDGGANDNVLGDPAKPDPAMDPAKGPIKQESPPMYMSLDEIKKITDPEKRQMASALFSLQQEVGAVRKNKLDEATSARNRRIEKLAKVLDTQTLDSVLQKAKHASMAFSMGKDGIVSDPMSWHLDDLERMAKKLQEVMPALLQRGAHFSEEAQPSNDGQLSDAEAEKLADQQTRNVRKSA